MTDYCLKPLGQKLTDILENIFDLEDLRKEFSHLSFNKIFEQEREDLRTSQLTNLTASVALGMNQAMIKQKLDEIWNVE